MEQTCLAYSPIFSTAFLRSKVAVPYLPLLRMSHLPDSYETLSLPAVKVSHHPANAPTVTPIVKVILNRPEQKNAFNGDMIASLERVFNLLSLDPRVKCIILTGSDPTNKIFCPGMDLSWSSSSSSTTPPDASSLDVDRDSHRDGGGRVSLALFRCSKPVIAALNGSAVGVGVTMTLPCAIRVTHKSARVGFVFARRGLVMEACSSFFLPRLLGTSRAMHLVTTGAVYPATDPILDGLFTTIVEDGRDVLPAALGLAEQVVQNCSAVSATVMRDMIYRGPGSPEEAHLLESKVLYDLFGGKDFVEGVSSFMEKREPRLVGALPTDAPSVWPWWQDALRKADGKAKL